MHRAVRRLIGLVRFVALTELVLAIGCQPPATPMPEASVTTPVGRPSICHQCRRSIAEVKPGHLLDLDGVRYVLCSEKCARKLRTSPRD